MYVCVCVHVIITIQACYIASVTHIHMYQAPEQSLIKVNSTARLVSGMWQLCITTYAAVAIKLLLFIYIRDSYEYLDAILF